MEEILGKLVALPTMTADLVANHEALGYIATYLKERGMHVERFEYGGHESLVATTRITKTPTIMLAAHVDVVVAPEAMFQLRKKDGKYFGRGVLDMKCAIAAYMQVVEELRGHLHEYDFGIMITTDEEQSTHKEANGVEYLLGQGYVPKAAVLPDGGQDWQLETVSNGYIVFTLEGRGKSGHSSRPWLGDSATVKLINSLYELQAQFESQGPDTDTLNIASLRCDAPPNQIPDYAAADFSIRLKQSGSLEYWRKIVAELCKKYDVTATEKMGWGVIYNDLDNPYVRTYADITEAVTGIKVTGFHSYAASDARFLAQYGIPYANAYPVGSGHHGNSEWIAVEALEQLKEIVLRYVKQMARLDQGAAAKIVTRPS
jgi:acetylornithine deacetylase/succinyl-diaminopimelate desuccinylase-like protein